MKTVNKMGVRVWMIGVIGVGLLFPLHGITWADSTTDSSGRDTRYVDYLKNNLSLNDSQSQQIQSILNNADSQLGPRPSESAPPADRQAYYQKLHDQMQNTQNSINGVLTDQQKTQYAQLQSQRGHHHPGGWDKGDKIGWGGQEAPPGRQTPWQGHHGRRHHQGGPGENRQPDSNSDGD